MFELNDSIFIDKPEVPGSEIPDGPGRDISEVSDSYISEGSGVDTAEIHGEVISDSTIVDLYFARDERAITETQSKYDNYLRRVSGNILRDPEDVSECVNDTYLGAWNAIPPTKPNIFRIFLARITRNLSIKKLRKSTAEKRGGGEMPLTLYELTECVAEGSRIDEKLEVEELTKLIEEFLSGRSEEDRKVFLCRYWYFDSIKEISKRFDYTESKVKMTLKRIRDELKEYLISHGVII